MFSREFKIPPNWIYRGEGNCNVVLSLPSQRKIVRIRKVNRISGILTWFIHWLTDIFNWYCGNSTFDELRDIKFYKHIIRPLFGAKFVCDAKPVFLSKRQLRKLERKLESQRPESRKHKVLENGRAALFNDYAFIQGDLNAKTQDTYAIEIKPKQGWIAFSEQNYPKCVYCMNQYIKKAEGQTQSISSYCPLDLFSGDKEKMCKALKALFYNPQNNLKLFKNGHFIYGQDTDLAQLNAFLLGLFDCEKNENLLEEFSELLQTSLVAIVDAESEPCDKNLFCHWNKIIQSNRSQLPKGCVLEKILSVQMLDMEGIQYYYKLLQKNGNKLSDFGYVTKLLNRFNQHDCIKCFLMNLRGDLEIVPYLISAIAKDCSLMLTFQRIDQHLRPDDSTQVIRTKHGDFRLQVGIFDLYPKPVSTIEKHWKKLNRMLDLCQ